MDSEAQVKSGPSEPQTPESQAKPVKQKKPATEKQIAQRQIALKAMQEKRKQLNEQHKEKKEKVKMAKKVVEDKILKEDLGFVTRQDFDSLRKELTELRAHHEATKIVRAEAEKAPPVKPAERIVERVIERPAPTVPQTPAKLTGHALLDRLFFDK